jgi:hypothetical protein
MEQARQGKRVVEVVAEFLVQEKFDDLPRETVEKVKEYVVHRNSRR